MGWRWIDALEASSLAVADRPLDAGFAIRGDRAFLLRDWRLTVADLSDRTSPAVATSSVYLPFARTMAVAELGERVVSYDIYHSNVLLTEIDAAGRASAQSRRLDVTSTVGREVDTAIDGSTFYVVDEVQGRLLAFDLTGSTRGDLIGAVDLGEPTSVTIDNGRAYVACRGTGIYTSGLKIVDISDPTTLEVVSEISSSGRAALRGDIAHVATPDGLGIYNLEDSAQPISLGFFRTSGELTDVALVGDTALVIASGIGLLAIDVSDPRVPIELARYETDTGLRVAADRQGVYLHDDAGLTILKLQ